MKNDEEQGELKMERVNTPDGTTKWRSCCLTMDKDFAIFFTKYFIIIGLITFFAAELHINRDSCEKSNLFQSLMLLLIGVGLPNPKLK
jgi:hypothetical protein